MGIDEIGGLDIARLPCYRKGMSPIEMRDELTAHDPRPDTATYTCPTCQRVFSGTDPKDAWENVVQHQQRDHAPGHADGAHLTTLWRGGLGGRW